MDLRLPAVALLASGVAAPAHAQTATLSITIPRLTVAEYHRPYVAVWLEKAGATPRTLAVWYDVDLKGSEGAGTKWLRDVRQWWRASGRTLALPADGISGATRAPGTHSLSFVPGRGAMPQLAGGDYTLVVEAAREVGGRELLRLPFSWPPKGDVSAKGTSELGAVSLSFKR
jgi:hypothetical protein